MKFIMTFFISTFLMANPVLSGSLDKLERGLDRLFGKEVESGADIKKAKKKERVAQRSSKKQTSQSCNKKRGLADKREGGLDKLFIQKVSCLFKEMIGSAKESFRGERLRDGFIVTIIIKTRFLLTRMIPPKIFQSTLELLIL